MTSTEDTQITELEIIRKYLFDRYDKLVVDVNNPSILKEDCDACDKRINIIDLIKKHSNPNDTGHLRELNYKYKKNILFIEPDKEIFNPRFRRFEIVKGEQIFKFGKKTYYDNIIFLEYIKNIYYKKSNIYNKNFIDELLDAIYKEKIEEDKKHKKLEEEKILKKEKELEKEKKQKELQEQQNIQTQKELHKLKKQNAETQKELQKLKKQNTETQDKKQKLQKQTITKSKPDNNKKKKKPISATIKRLVWNTNIGEQIGKAKCMCCNVTDMTQMSFNCGHIIAESNGGETIVSNLKPICQNCNSSMGTKNMEEFIKTLK